MPPNSDPSLAAHDLAEIGEVAEIDVVLPAHLHARPAGQLARVAARFRSDLQIAFRDRTAAPTGILAVMGLGATAGCTVTVRARGEDARNAVDEIAELLRSID